MPGLLQSLMFSALAAGSAMALPLDTVFAPPGTDTSRAGLDAVRETGRTRVRLHSIALDSMGGGSWRSLDTVVSRSNEAGTWSGDALLSRSWSRDSLDLAWRMWSRTGGLLASDPAEADHAWLQEALARWRLPEWRGARLAVAGGGLVERQDPGSLTLPLDPGGVPGRSDAAALWGAELDWTRSGEVGSGVDGALLEDQGSGALRLSRRSLSAWATTSLSGDGRDSLRVWAGWDSLRLRSLQLGSDRTERDRSAGAGWNLRAGRQTWDAEGSWTAGGKRDATGRSQGQDLTGWYLDLDLQGPLGGGWTHRQHLSRTWERRTWSTLLTGDPVADSAQAWQDLRDGSLARILQLSDTLRWTTDAAGGWTAWAGLVQSLRQVRHPDNDTPTALDRPDEDLSRRILTLSLSSPSWSPADRPLVSWTGTSQDDVFPRAVQSISTNHRAENRFSLDLDPSLVDLGRWTDSDSGLLRPAGGIWGREQRNRWRFDTSRTEGLLEEGWWLGGEAGPKSRPWLLARWKRWTTWTGQLPGADFAPDRIQIDWMLDVSGTIPVPGIDSLDLLPWFRDQVERIQAWDGTGWAPLIRSANGQAGMDLSWRRDALLFRTGAGREWSSPGYSGWRGSLRAEVAW